MRKILVLAMMALLLGACGTAAERAASAAEIESDPVIAETEATPAVEATEESEATAEPATDTATGDPEHGAVLFTELRAGVACSGCHRAGSDDRLVGPGLASVGLRAETRRAGMTAAEYLHQSIVEPGAFVVASYFNMMPASFAETFTEQEINDLVAYLMTLRG